MALHKLRIKQHGHKYNKHFHGNMRHVFDGQNCSFRTLVAVCDLVLKLHAHIWSAREVCALGRRWQRVFEMNNLAPSKIWCILP